MFLFILYDLLTILREEACVLEICCCCCCCYVASVVSDSVWPYRQQPTRLLHPWDSPGKKTGVSCHFLPQCMHAYYVASVVSESVWHYGQQPSRFLCPQDSPLEWAAISFSLFSCYTILTWLSRRSGKFSSLSLLPHWRILAFTTISPGWMHSPA